MSTLLKIAKIAKANLLAKLVVNEPIRNSGSFNVKTFKKKYILNEIKYNNRQILTITKNNDYKKHLIYLHGDSYTDEAIILHRIFIERIVDKYNVKVTFIDYPLIPESYYKEIRKFTIDAIKDLMKRYKEDTFYIIGDSAGAGLGVSMLQEFNKKKIVFNKSILISPWIDISMTNPKIKDQLKTDFTLNLDSLIECAKKYSKGYNIKGKLVSPIYGKLDNIGSLLVYTSDNELLYPDIIIFDNLVNKSINSSSKLIIGKDLCHDYPLLIIKETKGIIEEMMKYIFDNNE